MELRVAFHCRFFFRANARKIYARKWKRDHVWKATRKREGWARFNFYVYTSASVHCVYFIYARKIYVRTHVQNDATVEIHLKTKITPIEQERLKNRAPKQ